jgi:ABC-2 type transport system ATP-binding protein
VVIQTSKLTKRYGATTALDSLDLEIPAGEVYGFLGPNGAGKTTTIRLLLGLHRATSGSAAVFGIDAWSDPVAAHRRIGYIAGEPFLWPQLTGMETLEYLARLHGGVDHKYRDLLIERFMLEPDKKVRAYSKGNRQKVQLIAAFATRSELLIMDEPTNGLDPLMEVAFRTTVEEAKERDQTVFLSSHILSEVEALCDRIGILRRGKMIDQGTLAQLRHLSAQRIELVFEEQAPELTFPPDANILIEREDERTLRCEVSGPVAPLLAAIADKRVASLTSHEASLEEIFLHHYHSE